MVITTAIIFIIINYKTFFPLDSSGASKKAAKKKGSSFQTVSALFRVAISSCIILYHMFVFFLKLIEVNV